MGFSHTITWTTGNFEVIGDVSDEDLTTVIVTHLPTGIWARGNAKLHPEDVYSEEVGFSLAYYRADQRLARKLEKGLIRALPLGA